MKRCVLVAVALSLLASMRFACAEVKVVTERNSSDSAGPRFKFKNVPPPARNDAASEATFTLVEGARDNNGGELARLHDGRVAGEEDQPTANFFFRAGTDGGRIQIDLGRPIEIKQINSYSWHANTRAPQVYHVYGSEGIGAEFKPELKRDGDPEKSGWKLIAKVDSRAKEGEPGGQYGASISDSGESVGKFRYLLLDIFKTESSDPFGNTFFSEFDVIDKNGPAPAAVEVASTETIQKIYSAEDGKYQFTIDTSAAPDLTEWTEKELAPVVIEWYPKLVKMLPSEGFEAPTRVTLLFRDNMGGTPASAGGGRINCNIGWFRKNLKGEARGAVVHEMVHVVQNYGRARRTNPNATRAPGWLTEGIPDYLRFYKYEPQIRGAEISRRRLEAAKYDASYRVTGNFLNWVTEKYDKDLVQKLNAAIREGKYTEELWKDYTKRTVQELGDEWKKELEKRLNTEADATSKSPSEK